MTGYKIEFDKLPRQERLPSPVCSSAVIEKLMDSEVIRLMSLGAVGLSEHEAGEFISNIFPVPKPNGKIRLILNLKKLNEFVSYQHFKMEHLDYVTDLLFRDDYLASIDLSDAYFSVPVHPDDWRYLKFYWKGSLFSFRCLVFGLSSSPRIFTRLCKPILAYLRGTCHIRCSMYIDDVIIVNKHSTGLTEHLKVVCDLLGNLGFRVNWEKSVFQPKRVIKHLGFELSSACLTLGLPTEKCENLKALCSDAISAAKHIKIRQVAKLVGTLNAYATATLWGRLFIREIEKEMNLYLSKNGRNFEQFMSLSEGASDCIKWWLSSEIKIPRFFGHRKFDLVMESDASRLGWGGHCGGLTAGGRWQLYEQTKHINFLELKAFWLCLRSFVGDRSCINIQAKLDNTCAIHYLQSQGGVVADLNKLAKEIWLWCKARQIWIEASYIAGSLNVIADSKSRIFNDNTEWSLCKETFEKLCCIFGRPDIDLFASRLNFKVKKYMSCEPDPSSLAVNALLQDWSEYKLGYCFPPFNLIGKVLNKCWHDKAELLLVAPNWETQPWFPLIHDLLVDKIDIEMHKGTVGLPFNESKVHPIWNRLSLVAFRLSGKK